MLCARAARFRPPRGTTHDPSADDRRTSVMDAAARRASAAGAASAGDWLISGPVQLAPQGPSGRVVAAGLVTLSPWQGGVAPT